MSVSSFGRRRHGPINCIAINKFIVVAAKIIKTSLPAVPYDMDVNTTYNTSFKLFDPSRAILQSFTLFRSLKYFQEDVCLFYLPPGNYMVLILIGGIFVSKSSREMSFTKSSEVYVLLVSKSLKEVNTALCTFSYFGVS